MSADATPAPETEPSEKRGLRKWLGELSTGVKTIGGVAGAIAAVLGVLFLLLPNLRPQATPEEGSATFEKPTLEQPVTFGQYLRRVELPQTGYTATKLQQPGVIAAVQLTIKGYRGKSLPLRWYALDLGTHDIVDEQSKKYLFQPDRNVTPLTWPFWVAIPDTPGPFKIVFEIYPPGAKPRKPGVVPFAKAETDSFKKT
jgi:hypothetical protein